MSKKGIINIIKNISEPIAEELGYDLVDIEFVKEGPNNFLRVYIHKPDGVNLDDCQKMSQLLSSKLDEEDPISVAYYLEISSPGLDRPLKTDKDLERNLNKEIDIRLYRAFNGKKTIEGILETYDEDHITIRVGDNNIVNIPRDKVALIKLVVKF